MHKGGAGGDSNRASEENQMFRWEYGGPKLRVWFWVHQK